MLQDKATAAKVESRVNLLKLILKLKGYRFVADLGIANKIIFQNPVSKEFIIIKRW